MLVKAELVKELRRRTGAGMVECKKALQEAGGDIERAIVYLRERGLTAGAKKAGRITKEGRIEAYIHTGEKLGVLIEVNCETDFVAKTDDYQYLCRELAMQVAATNPTYVARADVPSELIEEEKSIFWMQATNEGKSEKVAEKIMEGRLEKYFQETCLLEQPYIRDPKRTVQDLLNEHIARLGENIIVRRFCRFRLGEDT